MYLFPDDRIIILYFFKNSFKPKTMWFIKWQFEKKSLLYSRNLEALRKMSVGVISFLL